MAIEENQSTTYTRELTLEQQAAVKARFFVTTVENPGFTVAEIQRAASQTMEALLAIEAKQGAADKPATVKRPGRPKKEDKVVAEDGTGDEGGW